MRSLLFPSMMSPLIEVRDAVATGRSAGANRRISHAARSIRARREAARRPPSACRRCGRMHAMRSGAGYPEHDGPEARRGHYTREWVPARFNFGCSASRCAELQAERGGPSAGARGRERTESGCLSEKP
ncbi:hypothetical protein BURPSS13_X0022 [Burkholderia pseudomallei S13]|uniref:Uncharacterized protein n=1 Tax=Burkholderia mallei (strain NCTC 10229) TaxID=412022 RepID=A2RWC2_BURM9|nr:hypothetical protein BMA10229_0166 [Burkholderia mallei NCTC 10229]EDS83837.1 hypothetical protein BURPSS13_X0022 [Burkholderia pseudomallei S13]